MNKPRTCRNLLEEAGYLTDNDVSYGAFILSRAIGRAMQLDGEAPHDGLHPNVKARRVAATYGRLLDEILPGKAQTSRRHVTITDAADLAFA
jgi:hypothetical protein